MYAVYFYIFLLVYPIIALWWKSFPKGGHKTWEAFNPGHNYAMALRISGQPAWWSILLLIPGIHVIMWMIINVSYIRKHGFFSITDTLQGMFFPFIIMAKIANDDTIQPIFTTDWEKDSDIARRNLGDHLVLLLTLPLIGHLVAFIFGGFSNKKRKGKKTVVKEWGDSILFALIAASIIRTYVFEPFKIPTGSMEKTLLVGDYLVVNKLAYGSRVPETPLSFPLVHNTIPWINMRSYTTLEKTRYTRLPGWAEVKNFDVVVFNYPSGDTAVYDPRMPNGLMGHDYHGIVNNEARRLFEEEKGIDDKRKNLAQKGRTFLDKKREKLSETLSGASLDSAMQIEYSKANSKIEFEISTEYQDFIDNLNFWKNKARYEIAVNKHTYSGVENKMIDHYGIIYRPVDKRENYIKRCIGIPGDSISIIDNQVYLNGQAIPIFPFQNTQYIVTHFSLLSEKIMKSKYDLQKGRDYYVDYQGLLTMHLTESELTKLQNDYPTANFELYNPRSIPVEDMMASQIVNNLNYYPKSFHHSNTVSNFEHFWIPKAGVTIDLTPNNVDWYERVITAYERHTFEEKDGKYFIDGKESTTYTFEQNYYWMMGDNRYNSADSRVWGFVPEDHIVGRASMVWYSKDDIYGVRWNRIFTKIK